MSLKNSVMPYMARLLTSDTLRSTRRAVSALKGETGKARFYFRVDDPYSWLLAQQLPDFCRRFNIQIEPKVMLDLPEEMYPEPEMHAQWGLADAPVCAKLHGLRFPANAQLPDRKATFAATRILLNQEGTQGFLSVAQTLCRHLWEGNTDEIFSMAAHTGVMDEKQATALLKSRKDNFLDEGHYLTGTLYYGGEWYWGPDRLDHLARRLASKQGNTADADQLGSWRSLRLKPASHVRGETLELFFSFRSPYSYLALDRIYRLSRHYGLKLQIRPVLPMVMRGLAVPKAKRLYIVLDSKREADQAAVPFGKICDPVGVGVERCMAIWPLAERQGKLSDFIFNAATDIWSQGVDVASDRGLKRILDETQIDWDEARKALADDSWRSQADANRQAMMEAGSWGVPSFRFKGKMFWGQDRIPALEQLILSSGD